MAISEEEEKQIRKKLREELEIQEKQRIESLSKLQQFETENDDKQNEVDEKKLEELRRIEIIESEKRAFYKEKGYISVKDKAGNTKWISKEEYEEKKYKIRVKRKNSGKDLNPVDSPDEKDLKGIFIIILIFVLFSIFLTLIIF